MTIDVKAMDILFYIPVLAFISFLIGYLISKNKSRGIISLKDAVISFYFFLYLHFLYKEQGMETLSNLFLNNAVDVQEKARILSEKYGEGRKNV